MMTSARPMAMSKSRVHTRISLRSVFAEDTAPLAAPPEAFAATGREDRSESGFSGEVSEPRCFWSERSIVGASVIYSMGAAARASCDFSHVAQKSAGRYAPSEGDSRRSAAVRSGGLRLFGGNPNGLDARRVQDPWPPR